MDWFNDLVKDIKKEPADEILSMCLAITLLLVLGAPAFFVAMILVVEFPWVFLIFIPAIILLYLRFVYKVPE